MKVHETHLKQLAEVNTALNQVPNLESFTGKIVVVTEDDTDQSVTYTVRQERTGFFTYELVEAKK